MEYHELGRLASLSAIGIDRHINGVAKPSDYDQVLRLSEEMEIFSSRKCKSELEEVIVLMDSVWLSHEEIISKTKDKVYSEVSSLAKNLKSFRELSPVEQIKLMYTCIDISRRAQARTNPFGYRRGFISNAA